MIVDPDFFEHWRTRMLVDALGGDQMAPMYVMRIWAHCQSRRATSFNMPAAGLRALCRFEGDAELLETSLTDAGFIQRNGVAIEAPTWAEYNSKLMANWRNGATGGRPKAPEEEPNDNPPETHGEPNGTQPEPTGTHAYPIREDKSREEKKERTKSKADASAARLPADWLPSDGDMEFCKSERPDLAVDAVAARFRDYWHGVPGAKGRKLDWNATWRNWVRSERRGQQQGPPGYQTTNDKAKTLADRLTGKTRNEQPRDIIDINERPA